MLKLPNSTANNVPLLALGLPTMSSRILTSKLVFLYKLVNGNNSLASQAIAANDLESVSIIRQCRFLELPYASDLTSSVLSSNELVPTSIKKKCQGERSRSLTACTYLAMLLDTPPNLLYFKWLKLMHGQSSAMKPLIGDQMAQNQLWQSFKLCARQHNCALPTIVLLKLLKTLHLVRTFSSVTQILTCHLNQL